MNGFQNGSCERRSTMFKKSLFNIYYSDLTPQLILTQTGNWVKEKKVVREAISSSYRVVSQKQLSLYADD